jgi:hypothetical protein
VPCYGFDRLRTDRDVVGGRAKRLIRFQQVTTAPTGDPPLRYATQLSWTASARHAGGSRRNTLRSRTSPAGGNGGSAIFPIEK